MGQLCPALTHCVFVSYLQFFFPSMTPQGTLGHSWQKTQIGFKAKLSRLKNEPSNPEQMELCVFFSSFARVSNSFSPSVVLL